MSGQAARSSSSSIGTGGGGSGNGGLHRVADPLTMGEHATMGADSGWQHHTRWEAGAGFAPAQQSGGHPEWLGSQTPNPLTRPHHRRAAHVNMPVGVGAFRPCRTQEQWQGRRRRRCRATAKEFPIAAAAKLQRPTHPRGHKGIEQAWSHLPAHPRTKEGIEQSLRAGLLRLWPAAAHQVQLPHHLHQQRRRHRQTPLSPLV